MQVNYYLCILKNIYIYIIMYINVMLQIAADRMNMHELSLGPRLRLRLECFLRLMHPNPVARPDMA